VILGVGRLKYKCELYDHPIDAEGVHESEEHMKKLIFLLVLLMASCTFTGNTETPFVSIATISNSSPIPASATPAIPTATNAPSPTRTPTVVPSPTATRVAVSQPWWNDTIFYEIYVRSFYDSNGDGIGDINGLIEKLDYLNDGIWLMPIHPSPSVHGYDVTDFYEVNPEYGTLEDFRRLVSEAHRRGIRLIIDLVINHTSNQHPWFIQSQNPQSPYHDWYIWADEDPGWLGPWNQQVWHELNGDYYYGFFWEGMPDLNYTNPAVTTEMENVTQFWLDDVGIDGFRLDAIGSLIEEGSVTIETQSSHDWFANFFNFYKQIKPEAMTIGEVWREDAVVIPWVVNKQVDLAFEFDLAAAMLAGINEGNSNRILKTLRSGTRQFPKGQYGTFLANHDMKRVMTQVGGSPEKAKAAASLYFTLPGVPFIYYGEEIGMLGEENAQELMQWSAEPFVGFSSVKPWSTFDTNYAAFNVSAETNASNSLLTHYRTLIFLRNTHPALRTGELFLPSTNNQGLFVCLRTTADESVLVIVNLTNAPIRDYELSISASALAQGEYAPVSLLDKTPLATLTVLDEGRILNFVPVPEILPYTTIMMLLQSK
jgi:alpha-amylase